MRLRRTTTTTRGYGSVHQRLRARWAPIVALGRTTCSRCPDVIAPGDPWDLDHSDDRTGYLGPAHRSCNRRAAALKVNNRFRRRSRRW